MKIESGDLNPYVSVVTLEGQSIPYVCSMAEIGDSGSLSVMQVCEYNGSTGPIAMAFAPHQWDTCFTYPHAVWEQLCQDNHRNEMH